MSLPRKLNDDFLNAYQNLPDDDKFLTGVIVGAKSARTYFSLWHDEAINRRKLGRDLFQGVYRQVRKKKILAKDNCSKVKKRMHIGMEMIDGEWEPIYIHVNVPAFFLEKFDERNTQRYEADTRQIEWKEKMLRIKNRIYSSRSFPAKLRAIIFERDNYCCRICGRHRDMVVSECGHLEVDHIHAWSEGG